MRIIDCKQGSTEWSQARLGLVTASEADALLTPTFKQRTGEGVETYMHRKICEKFLGWSAEAGGTWEMGQGNIIEQIAIPWYAFQYDAEPKRVGLCVTDDGRCGCSPDALLGNDNGLEIKSPQPPTHLKYFLRNTVPPEYLVQVHFSMFVTGRPHWTFVSFSRQLPSLVVRVETDPAIQFAIREAVEAFYSRFDPIFSKLVEKRDAENAIRQAAYEKST